MIFLETPVVGVWVIEAQPIEDSRGYFARTYDGQEFAERGLNPNVAQCSTSFNARAGTLRGMHYQSGAHAEAKLVRCTRGAIHDVALDLRPGSPSYLRWHAVTLTAFAHAALYVPEGCAHGFQTLEDDSEVSYLISTPHHAASSAGVRWDDAAFGIDWPVPPRGPRIISPRDANYPDYDP